MNDQGKGTGVVKLHKLTEKIPVASGDVFFAVANQHSEIHSELGDIIDNTVVVIQSVIGSFAIVSVNGKVNNKAIIPITDLRIAAIEVASDNAMSASISVAPKQYQVAGACLDGRTVGYEMTGKGVSITDYTLQSDAVNEPSKTESGFDYNKAVQVGIDKERARVNAIIDSLQSTFESSLIGNRIDKFQYASAQSTAHLIKAHVNDNVEESINALREENGIKKSDMAELLDSIIGEGGFSKRFKDHVVKTEGSENYNHLKKLAEQLGIKLN